MLEIDKKSENESTLIRTQSLLLLGFHDDLELGAIEVIINEEEDH